MKILKDKEASDFLKKNGFRIIDGEYVKKETQIKNLEKKLKFPWAIKASGKGIIHKTKMGAIRLNIMSEEQAKKEFQELKKIKNFEKAFIQSQTKGKEFLLGIKKTPEFGQVIAFGAGGVKTEKLKDISFRIPPIEISEAKKMIEETKISKKLNSQEKTMIIKNLILLSKFSQKYNKIQELDINPLINGNIVDARIIF